MANETVDCACGLKKIPTKANFCPMCGTNLHPDRPFSRTETSVAESACKLCGKPLLEGAAQCRNCGRRVQTFKRLCPHCRKEIPLTANQCKSCGRDLTIKIGHMPHVVCKKCARHAEMDDWAAARNISFLFQTEKGVKIACFPSTDHAAQVYRTYFEPKAQNDSLIIIAQRLENDDTTPWTLKPHKAVEFFNKFGCECGARDWYPSLTHTAVGVARRYAPPLMAGLYVFWKKFQKWWSRMVRVVGDEWKEKKGS